jgi:hypothetical protein
MFLILYELFILPLQICYKSTMELRVNANYPVVTTSLIIDMILKFFTSFYSEGNLVNNKVDFFIYKFIFFRIYIYIFNY